MRSCFRYLMLGLSLAAILFAGAESSAQPRAKIPPPPPATTGNGSSGSNPSANESSTKRPAWGNKADETADAAGIKVLTPIVDRDDELVFAPSPSPMVAIGKIVFDASSAKEVGKIDAYSDETSTKYALSPSGQYFAQTNKEKYHNFIEVIDTTTGQRVQKLEYEPGDFQNVFHMQFTSHNHLAAVVQSRSSGGGKLCLWRMSDGKLLREFPTERASERQVAFTGNGAYMAAAMKGKLLVFDVAKKQQVAEMRKPPPETGVTSVGSVAALAFAPDGNELAAIVTGKEAAHHLIIWGADGKIVEQHDLKLTIGAGYYKPGGIEWAPDGQGLLLHGKYYFDRKLGALAFIIHPHPSHHYPHRFLDDEHLLVTNGNFESRNLVSLEIPRQAIADSAEKLKSGTETLLKPGDTVHLKVEVGATKFVQGSEVLKELTDTITKRLEAGGLKVAAGAPVVLTVKYSEETGEDLMVVERDRFSIRGRPTGQVVKETIAKLDAEMVSGGKSIFKKTMSMGNPHHIHSGVVNDEEVRKAMFNLISYRLQSMQIPYFIPADDKALRLPVIADLREHKLD